MLFSGLRFLREPQPVIFLDVLINMRQFICLLLMPVLAVSRSHLPSDGDPASNMRGYCLILGNHKYSFPKGNEYSRRRGMFRFYHSYTPETAIFTEGQDHNDPDIADGVGFSTWKLEFLTPASGVATLIDQHVFGHYDEDERLPFTIVPLE